MELALFGQPGIYGAVSLDHSLDTSKASNFGYLPLNTLEYYNSYARSYFLTEKGYIGLGPESICSTDIIAVLLGCDMPVILRKAHDHYVLVGASFVLGLMDGEAIDMLDKDKVQLQAFEIH